MYAGGIFMLTALTVTDRTEKLWFKKAINFIKGNKINIKVNQVRGVTLKHIEYINRTGRINWNDIDRRVGISRNHLLCSEYLQLPDNMGYKRFYSEDFAKRLCTNMAMYILSKLENPQRLKVCLYDREGESADSLAQFVRYAPEIRVITENPGVYSDLSEMVLEETGISPVICQSTDSLRDCDFLVAPCAVTLPLPLQNHCVTLTSCCPATAQNGVLYFRYHFKMPNKFEQIKPPDLSDFYFASALYTKARQHQLGSIVPVLCSNYSTGARIESLCAYFDSRP